MNAIGNIRLLFPTVLAPMAGVTDLAFRILAKEMGCGLVVSEMISAKGLLHKNVRTQEMLQIDPRERPTAIQLFGSDPGELAEAAVIASQYGTDIIDFNMGCPTPKIVRNGEGSALLRYPDRAARILKAMVDAVDIPVTVKIRSGWDHANINAVCVAKQLEQAGVSAIAVHGRTREQFYSGRADWSVIRDVKNAVTIPVIGNGDVRSVEDAKSLLVQTGCDAVMIGRAACGNPWIFRQLAALMNGDAVPAAPTLEEKIAVVERHLDMLIDLKGHHTAIREMRRHAVNYFKGYPRSADLRNRFNGAEQRQDFLDIFSNYRRECLT